MPVYLVSVSASAQAVRLVQAPTKSAAIRHVMHDVVAAQSLTASEVVEHAVRGGVPVEKATEQPEPVKGETENVETTN